MNHIPFSVVATCYNDALNLKTFLYSLENQSLLPDECIIADGGSCDDTVSILKDYSLHNSKLKLRVICGKNLNIAQGYNVAIRNAKFSVVIIVGIGNAYKKNFFEELIKQYNTEVDIIYGCILGKNTTDFSKIYNIAFLKGNKEFDSYFPSNRGTLVRKAVFDKIGYFKEDFFYAGEDTEFYSRARKSNINFMFLEYIHVYWESPKTFKEYLNKRKIYLIGDMQCGMYYQQVGFSILIWIMEIIAFILGVNWIIFLNLILVVLWMKRIRSINIKAAILRMFDLHIILAIYILFFKYSTDKYRVK